MIKRCLIGMLLLVSANAAFAQRAASSSYSKRLNSKKEFVKVMTAFSDSLAQVVDKYSLISSGDTEVSMNPYFYRLFAPVTLYNSVVSNAMTMDETPDAWSVSQPLVALDSKGIIESDEEINASIEHALMSVYLYDPLAVNYTESDVMGRSAFKKEVVRKLPRREQMTDFIKEDVTKMDPAVETEVVVKKPNFWTKTGNAYLQFTQNYISGNWYNGGESNNTLLSGVVLQANYNDQQKVQWDNKLEWKLGLLSTRSDSLHSYTTNADLIRLTSKLGLQAVKNLYYTIQAQLYTQFFPNYKSNSSTRESSFLSPGYLTLDLGMDYKRTMKTLTLSAVLAPISYKLTYVRDDEVDETDYSVDEGKKIQNYIGSNLQVTTSWQIISPIKWESRLSYFTTYQLVQAEWENTINFTLNKYLSTKLFFHVRFDDSVTKKEGYNYFQLKELLSFGLSYDF